MEEVRPVKLDNVAGRSFKTRVVGSALSLHTNQNQTIHSCGTHLGSMTEKQQRETVSFMSWKWQRWHDLFGTSRTFSLTKTFPFPLHPVPLQPCSRLEGELRYARWTVVYKVCNSSSVMWALQKLCPFGDPPATFRLLHPLQPLGTREPSMSSTLRSSVCQRQGISLRELWFPNLYSRSSHTSICIRITRRGALQKCTFHPSPAHSRSDRPG